MNQHDQTRQPKSPRNKTLLLGGAGILAVVLLAAGGLLAAKKVSPLGWGMYGAHESAEGLAVEGKDIVALHGGRMLDGTDAHAQEWGGATWRFSSAENLATFAANPEQYAPAFGGFCSFAVSKGFTAKADVSVSHKADGRFYMFADADMKANWLADKDANLALSTSNWATH